MKDLRSAPTNGAEINAYHLIKRLRQDGFDAQIKIFDPLEDMDHFLHYLHSNRILVRGYSSHHLNYSLFDVDIEIDRRVQFDRDDYAHTDQIKTHIISELKTLKPDVIFAFLSDFVICEAVLEAKIPLVAFLTDNEFFKPADLEQHPHGKKIQSLIRNIPHFSALSKFLQSSFQKNWGKSATVLYGLMPHKDYLIGANHTRKLHGMVNTSPRKGFPLFALLAKAFPHESFSALLNAPASNQLEQDLDRLKKQIHNLDFEGPYLDTRDYYRKLKILLVPSVCEEAFGRVVVEAGINGIPVIGSDRGGIPEAMNGGGIVLEAPVVDTTGSMSAHELVGKNRSWFETVQKLGDNTSYEKECLKMREASFQMLENIEASYKDFVESLL